MIGTGRRDAQPTTDAAQKTISRITNSSGAAKTAN